MISAVAQAGPALTDESIVPMPKLASELLSVLRCPVTGSALVQQNDELISSVNGPHGEPLRYAIDEGIPVLLPPDPLPAADGSGRHRGPATTDSTTGTGQE